MLTCVLAVVQDCEKARWAYQLVQIKISPFMQFTRTGTAGQTKTAHRSHGGIMLFMFPTLRLVMFRVSQKLCDRCNKTIFGSSWWRTIKLGLTSNWQTSCGRSCCFGCNMLNQAFHAGYCTFGRSSLKSQDLLNIASCCSSWASRKYFTTKLPNLATSHKTLRLPGQWVVSYARLRQSSPQADSTRYAILHAVRQNI